MDNKETLFYELIRVAIGTQDSLSRLPSEREWAKLYKVAEKQSLVGICFAGLQKLGADADTGFASIGMSEMLYLTWMGAAATIQEKNDLVNRQCVEIQAKLANDGMQSCILKGQGVARLYGEQLCSFRQPGDIDVWVGGGMENVMRWVRKYCPEAEGDYVHAHMNLFDQTEVEVHYRYGILYNLWMNRKLQKWFDVYQDFGRVELCGEQISVPSAQFNALYLLLHIYRHLFASGVGLRQVMDYYFLLKKHGDDIDMARLNTEIDKFGLRRFAGALMWVINIVFVGHENSYFGIDANAEEGKYVLELIVEGGNFGHAKKRHKKHSHKGAMMDMVRHSAHLALHYGQEALWAPVWHVYHFFWKRTLGRN